METPKKKKEEEFPELTEKELSELPHLIPDGLGDEDNLESLGGFDFGQKKEAEKMAEISDPDPSASELKLIDENTDLEEIIEVFEKNKGSYEEPAWTAGQVGAQAGFLDNAEGLPIESGKSEEFENPVIFLGTDIGVEKESLAPIPGIPEYALEKKLKEKLENTSEQEVTEVTELEKTSEVLNQPLGVQELEGVGSEKGEINEEENESQSSERQEGRERREQRENFLDPPIEDWEDLYQAIVEVGTIKGSKENFSPWVNIELVNRVRRGENPIILTRAKGLRKAVLILLAAEAGEGIAQPRQRKEIETVAGSLDNPETEEAPDLETALESQGRVPLEVQSETTLETQSESESGDNEDSMDVEFSVIERGEETESEIGEEAGNVAREAFENAQDQNSLERARESRGSYWWNWFKERAKGFLTFGFWEVHQAEKVRKAAQKATKEILQGAVYLKKEGAMEESDIELIKTRLRESGNEVDNMSEEELREVYQWLSVAITERKIIANQQIEDEIVEHSIAEIEKRAFGYRKYEGTKIEMTADKKLSPEKRQEIEQQIRGALAAVRQGQIEKDMIKFSKMIRGSLDKNWYKRYVAGGIEAALGFVGVKWLVTPLLSSYAKTEAVATTGEVVSGATSKAVATGGEVAGSVGATPAVSEQVIPQIYQELAKGTTGMDSKAVEAATEATRSLQDNLWNMAKGLLKEKGLITPTDGQIMEVTKQLAADNSVTVSKWAMAGNIVDTKMPAGMAIKVGGAALKASNLARLTIGL